MDHSLGAQITSGPEKYELPKGASKRPSFVDTFTKTKTYEKQSNQEIVRGTL